MEDLFHNVIPLGFEQHLMFSLSLTRGAPLWVCFHLVSRVNIQCIVRWEYAPVTYRKAVGPASGTAKTGVVRCRFSEALTRRAARHFVGADNLPSEVAGSRARVYYPSS